MGESIVGDDVRIAVLDGGYDDYDLERGILTDGGCQLDAFRGEGDSRSEKIAFAEGAVGVFIRGTVLDEEAFDKMPSVRYVVRYGVGYDNVDLDAATRHGVKVCNVQGYASHSVSDHALALILACTRCLPAGAKCLQERYGAPPDRHMPDLKDMTLGIVGLGRIGSTLCAKARGLFRRVVAHDPYIPESRFEETGAESVSSTGLLAESDVVSIHCNLTDETRRMFDREALDRMPSAAILVNTARGPIVDEEALLQVIEKKQLRGAGVDVFEDEPPGPNLRALLDHPRVAATGHYAWYSNAAHVELQRGAALNMAAMVRGETPEDCLNPEVSR